MHRRAVRRRQRAFLRHRRRAARALAAARVQAFQDAVLLDEGLLLGPAPLPAIAPVADKEVEAEGVDAEAGLEADAEVFVVHAVLIDVGVQQAEVAGDGEEEVVVPGWEGGEGVFEHLGHFGCAGALHGDAVLGFFWEDFVREFAEPGFEHGADDVDVVEFVLVEEVDVALCFFVSGDQEWEIRADEP